MTESNNNDKREIIFGEVQHRKQKIKNTSSSSRYTLLTFLPISLWTELTSPTTFYFLILTLMWLIPVISPFRTETVITPFLFVVLVAIIREGVLEVGRWKQDRAEDNRKTFIFAPSKEGAWKVQDIAWKNIKDGHIVILQDGDRVPADCILLATSKENNESYMETSNLDGEKHPKPRYSVRYIDEKIKKSIKDSDGGIYSFEFEQNLRFKTYLNPPTISLYNFEGYVDDGNINKPIELGIKNFLFKGSKLTNTEWAILLAVYIGKDTKVQLNSGLPRSKISSVTKVLLKFMVILFIIQIGLTIFCTVLRIIYTQSRPGAFEESLDLNNGEDAQVPMYLTFIRFFVLLSNFIPISLVVTLECVRIVQSLLTKSNLELKSRIRNMYKISYLRPVKIGTTTINEELGQIQYVLTDKTGTLTQNVMELKAIIVGQNVFGGDFEENDGQTTFVSYSDNLLFDSLVFDPRISEILEANIKATSQIGQLITEEEKYAALELKEFMTCAALAHECIIDSNSKEQNGELKYQSPSPDEIAICTRLHQTGISFKGISRNKVTYSISGVEYEGTLHFTFEFDSDRKRQSVVVSIDGKTYLFVKGADSSIIPFLDTEIADSNNTAHVEKMISKFSSIGYRTLVFARRELSDEDLSCLYSEYSDSISSGNKEDNLRRLANKWEANFKLLGATAVEDKLQDNVKETISKLIKAKIKVWMITGDKLETAENIAMIAGIIKQHMVTYTLTSITRSNALQKLDSVLSSIKSSGHSSSIIFDMRELDFLFMGSRSYSQETELLRHLLLRADSVICARATPKQKASIVRFVMAAGKICLAVGDGANDVTMINVIDMLLIC